MSREEDIERFRRLLEEGLNSGPATEYRRGEFDEPLAGLIDEPEPAEEAGTGTGMDAAADPADSLGTESGLRPPEGYETWLDYAVAALDIRAVELEYLARGVSVASTCQQIRKAVGNELRALRRAAGVPTPPPSLPVSADPVSPDGAEGRGTLPSGCAIKQASAKVSRRVPLPRTSQALVPAQVPPLPRPR